MSLGALEGMSVAKFLCSTLTECFFFLYLLPYESLEINLFVSQRKKNKPCEKFCFMLPDMVVLGQQLSLRTELSAP